ncbi:MAG: RadC family protein [Alphaproteobacteria bacterium]|nr:RadC family protein [Alphaproteobacteria bacterium]
MIKDNEIQSLQQGHRIRLRQKFLDGKLTEYEMLELLLTYAIPRRDVRTLSRQLFKKYGSIQKLLSDDFNSLIKNDGIKENTATLFKLIGKITELEYKSALSEKPVFYNFEKLENYCKSVVAGKAVEEFHVLYLDSQFKLIEDVLHSSGTNDWAAVYIREIVKKALELNSTSVILLHNHPTPYTSFSTQDIEITQELYDALNKLNIGLYDHLLVSGDVVYSARNMHLLDNL